MNRQSSTSGNYYNCSKIFSSWRWFLHRPHVLTRHSLKWFQSTSDHVCNRAVALLTAASTMPRSYSPSTERHAAAAAIGHCKNFPSLPGTKAAELGGQWPDILRGKFLNASAWRSDCFPFRPNGITIRSQGTKAPVKTLEIRDRRSPLTTRRMSRIAKGSYCRARCCQKQALAQIAKSGGLRFRCQPCSQTGELREGWTPILARSYPNEASLCATAST